MAVTAVTYEGRALNNVEMGLKVSELVLPKIFAKIAYQKGYMVNDRYSEAAENSLDVLVPKFGRPGGRFESIRKPGTGETNSYNPFSPTAGEASLTYDYFSVDLEYRKPIKIAEDQIVQNVIGDRVIPTMVDYVSREVAEQINFITAEALFVGAMEYAIKKHTNIQYVTTATAGEKIQGIDLTSTDGNAATIVPDQMAILISKIGNADPAEGDTSFNDYKMSQVICNTLYAKLMSTKNQFIIESSYGQEILIDGTLGRISLGDLTSYKGRILGVDTFVLPDAFFPASTSSSDDFAIKPTAGKVLGFMAVAEATERAFVDRGVKITDAVDFRGWMLQPLYRVGCKTLKPWGVGLLVDGSFSYTNPGYEAPAAGGEGGAA